MRNTNGIIALLGLFIFSLLMPAQAQVRVDSPYSRYGIGDLNTSNNAKTESMGGLSFSIADPNHINSNNPASYAATDSGSFVFDAGFLGMMLESKASNGSSESNYFNLAHLKVGLPITRWMRASIGLMPYTTVGYDVKGVGMYDSIGTVEHRYIGDGGLNRFYMGAGFRIIKNLYIGANASYIFGKGVYSRETNMPDMINTFKVRVSNEIDVGSFYFDYGLQYTLRLSNETKDKENNRLGKYMRFGFVYANQQTLGSGLSRSSVTFTTGSDGYEFIKDTIFLENDIPGEVTIPAKIGGGLSYYHDGKWMIGFDVNFQDWAKFRAYGINDSLVTSISYHLGGSYNIKGYNIRAGFRYFDSYLELKSHKINDYGISFGVGFPLRSDRETVSYVDLGFEFGRRGTTEDGLIEQNYFKINLGVTIRNRWFQRQKYQ
jgi:hypothetical protein